MKLLVAGIAVMLLIGGAIAAVATHGLGGAEPVYSVSQLDAILQHHPASVVGHVIGVRGVVGFCPVRAGCPANIPPIISEKLGVPSPDPPLQLGFEPGNSLLANLRDLPVLGAFVPRPKRLVDGYAGVVRVRIEAEPPFACFERLCFEGVLQNTAAPVFSAYSAPPGGE
jgi:hypothetical protein